MTNALMCAKHKQYQYVKSNTPGESPLDGDRKYQGDIDFYVHVNAQTTKMQYAETFTSQINKFADLLSRGKALKGDDKLTNPDN
eukprot:gene504-797_t